MKVHGDNKPEKITANNAKQARTGVGAYLLERPARQVAAGMTSMSPRLQMVPDLQARE